LLVEYQQKRLSSQRFRSVKKMSSGIHTQALQNVKQDENVSVKPFPTLTPLHFSNSPTKDIKMMLHRTWYHNMHKNSKENNISPGPSYPAPALSSSIPKAPDDLTECRSHPLPTRHHPHSMTPTNREYAQPPEARGRY